MCDETQPGPGEQDLVFVTPARKTLDAANMRRSFRAVCAAAGIGSDWTLPQSFVSLVSDSHVVAEEIARLVGHASSNFTEAVYRLQLRAQAASRPRPTLRAMGSANIDNLVLQTDYRIIPAVVNGWTP
jgi:hypothetical protein